MRFLATLDMKDKIIPSIETVKRSNSSQYYTITTRQKKNKKKVSHHLPRPPKDKDKVKTKNLKVSEECHPLIGRMGYVYEDFGDVVLEP